LHGKIEAVKDNRRLLIVDLSVDPTIYRPVQHWTPHVEAVGVPLDVCRPPDGDVPSNTEAYSHAILTGSEATILSERGWVATACELTRKLDAQGVKLLGSCFGHQMLARSLSGRDFVRATPTPEFGWIEIRKRPDIQGDPVIDAIPARCHVYTSHFDEVFPLPPGWECAADTVDCPFAVVRRKSGGAWGIQPHPEIDVAEGQALHASYLQGMSPRQHALLTAHWHGEPLDDRIAGAIVRGFLG
jgi:GMP synthase (glutamine-hydrolysing)